MQGQRLQGLTLFTTFFISVPDTVMNGCSQELEECRASVSSKIKEWNLITRTVSNSIEKNKKFLLNQIQIFVK